MTSTQEAPDAPQGPAAIEMSRGKKTLAGVVTVVRVLLALVFITYGGVKLLGGQYYYGDWIIDKKTTDGTSLVWAFYGYSPIYGRFTGLFEFIPALMLLIPRTATLGAMGLFAVSMNVTVMDFAYGYPEVKYLVLGYTVIAALLVVYDRPRLRLMFARSEDVAVAVAAVSERSR